MKSTGIVRSIDALGRLVMPKEIRKVNSWSEFDAMEFFTDADTVIIRKYQPGCEFCGGMHELRPFGGKQVCGHCIDDLRKLYREGKV